jgi:hypothetical protein
VWVGKRVGERVSGQGQGLMEGGALAPDLSGCGCGQWSTTIGNMPRGVTGSPGSHQGSPGDTPHSNPLTCAARAAAKRTYM